MSYWLTDGELRDVLRVSASDGCETRRSLAMDIESIVKEMDSLANYAHNVGGADNEVGIQPSKVKGWARQLESYATSQREMRKGLEKLRELSEKATPGEWRSSSLAHLYLIADNEPSPICSMGEYQADGMVDGEFENWKANAAFIIGAVNFVRSAILEGKG